MKKILLIISLFFLTGCVSVTIPEDNSCYRYIDYRGEEHYMSYQDNNCYVTNGMMRCHDDKKTVFVLEFEHMECPKE